MRTFGGDVMDAGTTNAEGFVEWDGNGGLTNTCGNAVAYMFWLSVPSPNPYAFDVLWPTDSPYVHDFNQIEPASGLLAARQTLNLGVECACIGDGEPCTDDRCDNGTCGYAPFGFLPDEPEVCNGDDDNCDGVVDEGLPEGDACFDGQYIGCADETREGFMAWHDFPLVAACGGAWSVAGFEHRTCQSAGGNHGTKATGTGCSAADLCAIGWHVCYGPEDVDARLGAGDCSDALDPRYPNFGSGPLASGLSVPPGAAFFATAARTDGAGCSDGVGDQARASGVFGCGNLGAATDACGALDRASGALCAGLRDGAAGQGDHPASDYGYAAPEEWAWSCAADGAPLKSAPDRQGGVLCCKDSDATLPEVCDGRDNDLDGATDEHAFNGVSAVEVGAVCRDGAQCGTLACAADGGWACSALGACTADSTCDGFDDDGDGSTDEEFDGTETRCGIGACAATGTRSCSDGVIAETCTPGAKAEATDVTCDGIDGDCDGDEDEEFRDGLSRCGVGACEATGQATCIFGALIDTCVPKTSSKRVDDTCNSLDDDCDGTSDEEVAATPTTCGSGACAGSGAMTCVNGAMTDTCRPSGPATDVTCDGIDDDCDGGTDEDNVATVTTCGVGACAGNSGSSACSNGAELDSCDPLARAGKRPATRSTTTATARPTKASTAALRSIRTRTRPSRTRAAEAARTLAAAATAAGSTRRPSARRSPSCSDAGGWRRRRDPRARERKHDATVDGMKGRMSGPTTSAPSIATAASKLVRSTPRKGSPCRAYGVLQLESKL